MAFSHLKHAVMFSAGIKSARKARERHANQIFVELFEYPSNTQRLVAQLRHYFELCGETYIGIQCNCFWLQLNLRNIIHKHDIYKLNSVF